LVGSVQLQLLRIVILVGAKFYSDYIAFRPQTRFQETYGAVGGHLANGLARIGGSLAESQTALAVVATAHHGGVSKHGFK